ncbi:hypothetical protein ACO0LV_08360 [Pseudactinotalea sp. Z1739]|uniref:hypothetical protein n=1 Tax=Pseudactinotalea sp. Z1739 TaxID=3413028 RepID=UPI003C7E8550
MSGTSARLIAAAFVGTGLLAGCASAEADEETAACAAPVLSVSPASATAGEEVLVMGENFLDGCPGASASDREVLRLAEPAVPYLDVAIQMVDSAGSVTLTTVDAGTDGTFEVTVPVPQDQQPGVVELITDVPGTRPAELVIGLS